MLGLCFKKNIIIRGIASAVKARDKTLAFYMLNRLTYRQNMLKKTKNFNISTLDNRQIYGKYKLFETIPHEVVRQAGLKNLARLFFELFRKTKKLLKIKIKGVFRHKNRFFYNILQF